MGKPMYHKLSKQDLNRHFPNIDHGGKGSTQRKSTLETRKNWDDNWERIFGKKDKSPLKEDTDNDQSTKSNT